MPAEASRPKRLTIPRRRLKLLPDVDPPPPAVQRPRTRADCIDGPRPCPFVSCRHHLYLDVRPRTGSLTINFPELEPHELEESCSLDVADRGETTLERVGELTNMTRERARQLEVGAIGQLERLGLDELRPERPHPLLRIPEAPFFMGGSSSAPGRVPVRARPDRGGCPDGGPDSDDPA